MFISKRSMKYILITIAAAMAASVVLMFAVKRPATAETPEHQGHVNSEWTEWTNNDALPTSGSYYLTGDVNLSATAELTGDLTLCLNGFTISGSVTKFKVTNGHTLNICDCSDGESGKLTGTTDDSAVIVDGGTFNLYSGSISDNKNGGGVAVQNSGIFNMYGGFISENKSESTATNFGYGGGVFVDQSKFTMSGGEISGNTASKDGGGVYLKSAEFIMSGGTISYNKSLATTANTDHIVGGGGVYVGGGSTFEMSGGSKIEHNTATVSGGGVNVETTDKFTMESGKISENTAKYGGGVYSQSYMLNSNPTKFTMNGGEISKNNASESGGGVCVEYGYFEMSGGEISDNKAKNGGGVNVGGGYNNGIETYFTLSGGTIKGNTATESGGGIWIAVSNSATTMENGNVSDNTATNGGGIWIGRNTMKITDSTISGNTATVNGGGVCADNGYLTIDGTIISDNDANQNGGGLYINSISGPINAIDSGSKISGNTATNGGGVYLSNGTFQINSGEVSGNTATVNGGGIYADKANLTVDGCQIEKNNATDGGGIWAGASMLGLTIKDSTISQNTVTGNGGGVCHMYSNSYTSGNNYPFTVDGAVNITGNYKVAETVIQSEDDSSAKTDNNVCLYCNGYPMGVYNYKKIAIGSSFNAGESKIGVNVYDLDEIINNLPNVATFDKTCRGGAQVTTSCSQGVEAAFISDDERCDVRYNNTNMKNYVELSHPHDWGDWEIDEKNHSKTCKNCGTSSGEDGEHEWDAGVVTKQATTTETGEKTFTCTVCQYQKTEEIPIDDTSSDDTPSESVPSGGGGTRPSAGTSSDSTPSESEPSDSTPTESSETPPESGNPTPSESVSSTDESSSEPSEIAPPISDNPATGITISVVPLALILTALGISVAVKRKNMK